MKQATANREHIYYTGQGVVQQFEEADDVGYLVHATIATTFNDSPINVSTFIFDDSPEDARDIEHLYQSSINGAEVHFKAVLAIEADTPPVITADYLNRTDLILEYAFPVRRGGK